MKMVPLFLVLGATLTVACAVPPSTAPPAPSVHELQADFDDAWSAIIRVFTDEGIPIENMDPASGFIRSGDMTADPSYVFGGFGIGEILDCGSEFGVAHTTSGTSFISFTALVEERPDSRVTLRIVVSARNYDKTSMADPNQLCVSTGIFERLFAENIAAFAR